MDNSIKQRNWTGLVLVILGLVFLLKNLHILPLPSYFFTWKTLLIVIGVVGISLGKKEAYIPLIIGASFLVIYDILGMSFFSFRDLWPIVLILIGLSILMRHRKNQVPIGEESRQIDGMAIFSSFEKKVTSQDFIGGNATAIFGGIDIDMKQASLSEESNTIDLFTLFGGAVFKIPTDWTINISQLTVVFGGFEDQRHTSKTDPNKVLHIKGLILFGGGELKNA